MDILTKVDKADFRFVPVNPDPDFDPKHNEYVIEKTIKEYEATRAKKHKEAVEKVRERTNALATFIKSVEKGGTNSNLEKFFGKKEIARLRANVVRDKLDQLKVLSPDGKLMRKAPL